MPSTWAVGTGLAGNLHAIFTLRTAIAEGSDDRIDNASFSKGIRRVIDRNPNGPAAKWILMEYRAIICHDDGGMPRSSRKVESSTRADEVNDLVVAADTSVATTAVDSAAASATNTRNCVLLDSMGGGDTSVLRGEPAAAAASATMGAVSDLTGKGEVDAATPAAAFDRHFETMFNAFNAANEEDDQLEDEDGASEQDAVEAAAVAASSSALSAAASSGTSCTL